eukprot:gene9912-12155_t
MSSVKVAVRVRPFNSREKERNAELIIQMNGNSTTLIRPAMLRVNPTAPPTPEDEKVFTFDHSYWSFDNADPHFASQKTVFDDIGKEVLGNAWEGFNCSIFAYGQTGSGKSYSMLGYGEDKGIIPLVCEEMFERINTINENQNSTVQTVFKVEVSFMEIYNERVKDLLNPKNNKAGGLKVRNSPTTGPYVEDLSKLAVKSFQEIDMLMDEGSKARTVASTNMNATSSRSHAVFTIVFTQSRIDKSRGTAVDRVSKISLVDLAGSERANSTGATGVRLKEGANINKSLSTLGKVISALAENSTNPKKAVFVPYRDSVLTYLLKESLGGNSKTIMIAAISPADINYEETLSTLRYADSAKKIKTVAVVNEDAQSKLIRELSAEVERLKSLLAGGNIDLNSLESKNTEYDDGLVLGLNDKIEQYEKLMAEMNKSWEEKLSEAEKIRNDRMAALKDMGVAIKVVSAIPHLINLNEDPLMSESLIYYIKEGITRIGRSDSDTPQDIILNGLNIHREHCTLENKDGIVTIIPPEVKEDRPSSSVYVNGIEIACPTVLSTGNRVILGNNHIFRFNHPEEAAKIARERGSSATFNANSTESDQIIDYDFALKELASTQGNLAMSRHIGDKAEFQRQLKLLYEQMRKQLEIDFDPEIREKREKFAIIAIRRWRAKVYRSRLLNEISQVVLLINEANAISDTLSKGYSMGLKLYSLYPDSEQISDSFDVDIDWRKTQIGIKVLKKDTGETTILSDQDFIDRVHSMRELYQSDGSLEPGVDDPFNIPFDKNTLIGVSHVYLNHLLYLISLKRPYPILDQNGNHKGYLNVSITPKSDQVTQDEISDYVLNPTDQYDYLLEQPFTMDLQIEGLSDFKDASDYSELHLRYTFQGEAYQSSSLNETRSIHIPSVTESFIKNLESEYFAIEVWGKKVNNNVADFGEKMDQSLKQPMLESFDFLASVNILESDGQDGGSPNFKPVHILEDPDASNRIPSVTFRLKKEKTSRTILFKILKNESNSHIKQCRSAKISEVRVFGKRENSSLLNPSNTPSTPSTPNPSRGLPMTPSTPMTPYNQSTSQQLPSTPLTPFPPTPNGTPIIKEPHLLNGNSNGSSTTTTSTLPSSSSVTNFLSLTSTGNSTEFIELPVLNVTEDSVLLSWETSDPSYLLNQKTRKGDKFIFKLTFELELEGFPSSVFISKDISVKTLQSESMVQGAPEGANSSMSNLLDKFKTHLKGESILSEPSIHAGSLFNLHLTKSRQLEYKNKIGAMIDVHQENILKLGYAMKMEKLRQELNFREKLGSLRESHPSSGINDQNSDRLLTEEIVKKMSLMNNASQSNNKRMTLTRKQSSAVIEVNIKEVGSSALLKEDEMRGYLKKKSAFKDDWKPRYFVLKRPYLYYSHSEKDTHKNKKIDLTNASVTILSQDEFPYGFAIIQFRRVWLLQASSNDELESWLQILDPLRKVTELKDAELRTAKQQIEKSSSQLDQIKSQLQTNQQIVLAKQKEVEDLTNLVSQLQLEREVTSQQYQDLKMELEVRDEEIQRFKLNQDQKLEQLNDKVDHLHNLNENKEVQIGSLSSTLQNTNHIIELLTEQSKNYKNVAEMEIDSLRDETTSLRETNQLLLTRFKECKDTIQKLEQSNSSQQQRINEANQTISSLKLQNENMSENSKHLANDSTMKQNQIDVLSKTVEQSTKTIQHISDQFSSSNRVNEKQKSEIQTKEDEITSINTAYQSESNKLKEQTAQLNNLTATLRTQMKTIEQGHSTQKENFAVEQKQMLLLLQDLETGLNNASLTITEQTQQNALLKKELVEASKSKEVVGNLEKQLSAMKDRLIKSENQLIDLECENTLLSDKVKMWEEEIKIKDAKLDLLENNVKEVRAEYANGMAFSREFANQDLLNGKNKRKSKQVSQEEMIESMRESSIAHQTHNAFLNMQLQRLENEMRQQEKVYNDTIQRIKKDLQQRNQQNIAFMKQQASDETIVKKLEDLDSNYDQLKKKYFVSLVVAAKLQNSMMGNICNVDAYEMYEQAMAEHLLDQDTWPNWIALKLSPARK